jgi:hypothetical protein
MDTDVSCMTPMHLLAAAHCMDMWPKTGKGAGPNAAHTFNLATTVPWCPAVLRACCLQAITEAVNAGGSLRATRRAGYVGTSGSWAVTQGNRVFNVVDWQNTWGRKRKQ